ncbi:uncharacterized protein EDB93DRAFT_1074062 [Suillus bovinus]|uniref:uncharacterized protein n=1 Tax=Suillus bovinus TaxID=48563 RepID=UPI001B87632C|nr:uncharacterized protein EDB93DRAFT_1074062 [Suillus bovinus]KAG2160051.1 hypothetical protein EDB93DRAFT_1074062 [Suillus bovinus]
MFHRPPHYSLYGNSKASLSCMDNNDYNRDNCLDFFQTYRDCNKAWLEQRREDRGAGRPTPI